MVCIAWRPQSALGAAPAHSRWRRPMRVLGNDREWKLIVFVDRSKFEGAGARKPVRLLVACAVSSATPPQAGLQGCCG